MVTRNRPVWPNSQRPMGVLVLYNEDEAIGKGEARDLIAIQGVIACARAVAEALTAAGHRVAVAPIKNDIEAALAPFPSSEWVIFNLAEGVNGRLFEESRMIWTMEAMGYHYTGPSAEAVAHSTNKAMAKQYLAQAGVSTPAWRLYRHAGEVVASGLVFPLIVKPVAEDASQGIGEDAVVHDVEGLRQRVQHIVEHYHQAALAEQYIAGREFNVGLWGTPPETLPIAEIDFVGIDDPCARIVSFAAKWEPDSFLYQATPAVCPAVVEPELEKRILDVTRRAWQAIGGGRGHGRVDMRVDEAGRPYVIEINCNPDISPDAGFFRAARVAGYTYQEMVLRILESAWQEEGEPVTLPALELAGR